MWFENPGNRELLARLRRVIGSQGRVLIFLGAGVSFGAARLGGRTRFDYETYRSWPLFDFPPNIAADDDELPLPSWPWLVNRMWRELAGQSSSAEMGPLRKFFIEEGPLDCAQLFRQSVGESRYREFLLEQFDTGRQPFIATTPSHHALVALDLPLLFTTNYDELIEAAYREANQSLRVSISEQQFRAHRAGSADRHLVKLHGSIDQPDTIVLTRNDYARARAERTEMLSFLRAEMAETSFLFLGFSLSDPNFGLLHDDIRLVYGLNAPVSYTVQASRDPIKERYLRSLDIHTLWLDSWNQLPDLLRRLHPQLDE